MLCDGGFPGCKPVVDEPDQVGEPCTFIPAQGEEACNDSCVPGAQCWNVDPQTNEGTCWATCTGSAERPVCEDPGTLCLGGASDFADLLCVPLCDPLGQDCPEGEGCYWVSEVYACLVDNSGDGGEPGASCSIVQDCDPGNLCLDPSLAPDLCGPPGLGCCIPFCDIDQGPCPGGEPCTSVYAEDDPIPPGLEHVGICGGG